MIKSLRDKGFYDKALALEVLIEEIINNGSKCLLIKKSQKETIISFTQSILLLNLFADCSNEQSFSNEKFEIVINFLYF